MSQVIKKEINGECVIVSVQDAWILDSPRYNWCINYMGKGTDGTKYVYPYVVSRDKENNNKSVSMHRTILEITDKNCVVDHIDGNPLNNSRDNLRRCSHKENICNSRKHSTRIHHSTYKGVCRSFYNNDMWRAKITTNGKTIHIGEFERESVAALAYDLFAIKLFGQYARINFPHLKSVQL